MTFKEFPKNTETKEGQPSNTTMKKSMMKHLFPMKTSLLLLQEVGYLKRMKEDVLKCKEGAERVMNWSNSFTGRLSCWNNPNDVEK